MKLDKKLILNIENIEYKSEKTIANSSIEDIKKNLDILPFVLKWFQSIDIEKLSINDNIVKIVLNKDILSVENKFFLLDSKIDVLSKEVLLDINNLYLKDYNILFKGKAKIDYFDEELKYFGDIYYQDLIVSGNIDITKDRVNFFIKSEIFKNLHFLKKYLDLPEVANSWMYDNVTGDFKLNWFYGEFDLNKNEIIEKSLQGDAVIENAKIRFENSLEEINTSKVNVNFKNSTLHFDLVDAIYKGKELKNSFVTIKDIANENSGLVLVNIEAKTSLDKDILGILEAYGIVVPVLQKNGETQAKLLLSFPYAEDKPMRYNGVFIAEKSNISISGFDFETNGAKVILENDLLYINDASFIYQDIVDAKANLKLDLNSLKIEGTSQINKILVKDSKNSKILNITNINSDIFMDFSKNVNIELKDLKTTIKYDKFLTINLNDISKIYNYSDILKQNNINNGNISLKIMDKDNIDFNGFVSGFVVPIKKDNKEINSLDFYGNINKDSVQISSIDNSIRLNFKDNIELFLDGYDIYYNENISKNSKLEFDTNIDLKNSKLFFDNQEYKIKSANFNIKKDLITFNASLFDLDLPIKKDNQDLKELDILGKYKNDILDINSKKDDIFLRVRDNQTTIKLDGYDIFYDTKYNDIHGKILNIGIIGTKSNIVINNKNKILADFYELNINKDRKFFYLEFEDSKISFTNKNNNIDIYAAKINEKFINTFANSNILDGGKIDFFANGTTKSIRGKLIVEDSSLKNVTILNNIMFLVESSPAFINPLLAIPAVFGLNKLGIYKIKEGVVEFEYDNDKNLIDIKNLHTVGNGMDFEGKGVLDLNKKEVDATLNLVFLKTYSSVFEYIPIVNYILLGDEKRVETQIQLTGSLSDPVLTTNLFKDGFSAPLNIFKRVFTTPSNMIDNFNKFNQKD
ncbi:YhdP family protein [Aliarcobacter cryaerophilus]|uniref:YhdP family protein n=1 Tax=Aliarcobacter cryaerophilus TaxID=28198 RepID=UPI003DA2E2A7